MNALTGTEKQIAWAEKIRAEFIERTERVLTVRDDPRRSPDIDERMAQRHAAMSEHYRAAIEAARAQTSAAWWIEHRSDPKIRERLAGPDPRSAS